MEFVVIHDSLQPHFWLKKAAQKYDCHQHATHGYGVLFCAKHTFWNWLNQTITHTDTRIGGDLYPRHVKNTRHCYYIQQTIIFLQALWYCRRVRSILNSKILACFLHILEAYPMLGYVTVLLYFLHLKMMIFMTHLMFLKSFYTSLLFLYHHYHSTCACFVNFWAPWRQQWDEQRCGEKQVIFIWG